MLGIYLETFIYNYNTVKFKKSQRKLPKILEQKKD